MSHIHIKTPEQGKLIMPALEQEQVLILLNQSNSIRAKAVIASFAESGLRLSELTNIRLEDTDRDNLVRTIGKSNKEGFASFGKLSEDYLNEWLSLIIQTGTFGA